MRFLILFFYWYYWICLKSLLKIWRNFLIFFWHYFSIGLLLKTFFRPWKRIVFIKKKPGFDFQEIFQRWVGNLASRFFGAVFRSGVIIAGLIFELLALFLGLIILVFWLTLPFLIIIGFFKKNISLWYPIIIIFWLSYLFYQSFLKEKPFWLFPAIKKLASLGINFSIFDYSSAKIIHRSLKRKNPFEQVNTFKKNLLQNKEVKELLLRLGISEKNINQFINSNSEYLSLKEILETAFDSFEKKNLKKLKPSDLLYALAKLDQNLKDYLFGKKLEPEDIIYASLWQELKKEKETNRKKFWRLENLLRKPGLAKDWAYGYTPFLDKYANELTKIVSKEKLEIIIHQKEIEQLEQILARAKENNALVIGHPGTGRQAIIKGLAQLIREGRSLPPLEYKRVLELDLNLLLANFVNLGELRSRLTRVFVEAEKAGNIILVINNFHHLFLSSLQQINIFEIILPYLSSKHFQLIGITDYKNFHRYLEPNPRLMKLFEKVEVREPNKQETFLILQDLVETLEKRTKVTISYQALKEIIEKTDIYLPQFPFPEKAIDLLDEAVVYVATQTKDKILLPSHIDHLLSRKTGIPIGRINNLEKIILLNLEKQIHQMIVNQEEAVKVVSDALRRARIGLKPTNRPIGSFLFLGPTGVGKTSLARALARIYFGSEKRMIRLDMTAFKDVSSVHNLIGSFKDERPGVLTSAVRERPYTLVLLDEIEKAAPNILDLFLELLDEGRLRDAFGEIVSFRNTIIIATSNAGAELIRETIKKGESLEKLKPRLLDYLQKQGIFKPEFLNRFDAIVLFKPLSEKNILDIAQLLLEEVNQRLKKEHRLTLLITEELKRKIVELGYDPVYGARAMRRVIQDKIESLIAKKILKDEIKKDQIVRLDPEEIN